MGVVCWTETKPPLASEPVLHPAPADPIDQIPILFS
jgi:hypothetical protein